MAGMHLYEVRPRKDKRGVDLISDVLSHGELWYHDDSAAISYAKWNSRVKGCKIDVLNETGEIVKTERIEGEEFAY
jgi:hypothetical protein